MTPDEALQHPWMSGTVQCSAMAWMESPLPQRTHRLVAVACHNAGLHSAGQGHTGSSPTDDLRCLVVQQECTDSGSFVNLASSSNPARLVP